MIAIHKSQEPIDLVSYRAHPGAIYDGANFTPVKNIIRKNLLADQGHLCAYCMQRIRMNTMKIEHWHSQDHYPSEGLVYSNMLGCCFGNQGSCLDEQHCDTKKRNADISFNPADPSHHPHLQIHYSGLGEIRSDSSQFDYEIREILNLNLARLKKNRESVHRAVQQALSKKPGARTKSEVQGLIDRWKQRDSTGCLKEFFPVAIYFLNKKLNSLA